jgi:hypothetical protein
VREEWVKRIRRKKMGMRKEVYNINHQKRTEGARKREYTNGEINLVCQIWEEHLG